MRIDRSLRSPPRRLAALAALAVFGVASVGAGGDAQVTPPTEGDPVIVCAEASRVALETGAARVPPSLTLAAGADGALLAWSYGDGVLHTRIALPDGTLQHRADFPFEAPRAPLVSAAIGDAYVVVAVGSFCTRLGGNCTRAVHLDAQGRPVGAQYATSDGNQWHSVEGSAATDSALYVAQGARYPPVPIYRYTPTPAGVEAVAVVQNALECTGGVGFAALLARGARLVGVTQGEALCDARVRLADETGLMTSTRLPLGTVVDQAMWADEESMLLIHHRTNEEGERVGGARFTVLRTDGSRVAEGRLRGGVSALPADLARRRVGALSYGPRVSFRLTDVLGDERAAPIPLGRGRSVRGSGVPGVTLERTSGEHWVFFADRRQRREWAPTWVRVGCASQPTPTSQPTPSSPDTDT